MTGQNSHTMARAAIASFFCRIVCVVLITVWPEIVTWLRDYGMGPEKK